MEKNEKNKGIKLSELAVGQTARIEKINMPAAVCIRLSDLGMNRGAFVGCLGKSPLGDPKAYIARGRVIAIRLADAENIICKTV